MEQLPDTDPERPAADEIDLDEASPAHAHAGAPDGDKATPAPVESFQAMQAVDAEAAADLQAEWGADFDHNIALARRAAAAFADHGLIAALEESGLGDDPRIVRAAAAIGRALDSGSERGPEVEGSSRRAIEAELDDLNARDDYWSAAKQRRIRELYLQLYGQAPLPTHRDAGDGGSRL